MLADILILISLSTQPEVGDCVFYLEKNRPSVELAAALWYTFYRKYRQNLPVKVASEIKYSRPGVGDSVLVCNPGRQPARTQSFKKEGGKRASVMWPEDK